MSDKNGSASKIDMNLNVSPPSVLGRRVESPTRLTMVSPASPPSSCASNEINQEEDNNKNNLEYSNTPETTSMVIIGCPHCLMYVLVFEDNIRCPKCKNTNLIEFSGDNNNPSAKRG